MRLIRLQALRKSSGFSLLEVIVSLAVLGIGVVAVMQLYSAALRTIKKAEDHTRATIFARSLLEEAMAKSRPENLPGTFDLGQGAKGERSARILYTTEQTAEYEVTVRVELSGGESVELTGLRTFYTKSNDTQTAP